MDGREIKNIVESENNIWIKRRKYMNKVTNILGEEIEFDCMGCDIGSHKLVSPRGYIYENNFVTVCADSRNSN